jgi:hypothetical protein
VQAQNLNLSFILADSHISRTHNFILIRSLNSQFR